MANKITVNTTVKLTGTNVAVQMSGTTTTDQVGTAFVEEVQLITSTGTSGTALDIPTEITEGECALLVVKNTAATLTDGSGTALAHASQPFVDIATDQGMTSKIMTIDPGTSHVIGPPGGTKALYALANAADTEIVFLAIER